MDRGYRLKNVIALVIVSSIIGILYLFLLHVFEPAQGSYKAHNGIMELSDWPSDSIVMLNGVWDYYPNQLLEPGDISQHAPDPIGVPGEWIRVRHLQQKSRGFGTYHLTVKLPVNQSKDYSIKIQSIWMSHKVYINGKPAGEAGKAVRERENYSAQNTPYVINLGSGKEFDILIQVVNYSYYDGGIVQPILLGETAALNSKDRLNYSLDMSVFISFMIIGTIHIYLYILSRKVMTYLYSGSYLIILGLSVILSGEKLLMRCLSGVPFEILYKLQDLSVVAGVLLLNCFLNSLQPNIYSEKVKSLMRLPIMLYGISVLLLPYPVYIVVKPGMAVYMFLFMIIMNTKFIISLADKRIREIPFNEYLWIVASIMFIAIAYLSGMTFYGAVSNSNAIGKTAIWSFLFSITAFIARRYMNTVDALTKYSMDLIAVNQEALQNQKAFLQAQIKPHFIYNALNNIIALCYEDGEKAAYMLTLLSKYLRNLFQREDNDNYILLLHELEIIENYVMIEKLRFGERLVYRKTIAEGLNLEEYFIPVLILQPIVENAIIHGVFNKIGTGHVDLILTQTQDSLIITVKDDGIGMDTQQVRDLLDKNSCCGVAIKNILSRLEMMPEASFQIESESGRGTEIRITLLKHKITPEGMNQDV